MSPTPADGVREMNLLIDKGVSHIAVNFDTLDQMKRFIDEVVPKVRLERHH